MFKKYMHIEKFGNDEVDGINGGDCYVFPKLDGTNASVWYDNGVKAGSRNRELTEEQDNAGFCQWAQYNQEIIDLLHTNPEFIVYGEWLVPHTIKGYKKDAWRKFWVFDVWSRNLDKYLPYNVYAPACKACGMDVIPPMCVINNPDEDMLVHERDNCFFLMEDDSTVGEGIVIKNYNFINRYGRPCHAKMVCPEHTTARRSRPKKAARNNHVEISIVEEYLSLDLINKTQAKVALLRDGWNSKCIGQLLGTVYHDFVTEEIWNALKKFKYPTINFRALQSEAINRIKELKPELF